MAVFDAKRLPTCPTIVKYHREGTRLPGGLPRSSLAARGVRPENDGNIDIRNDDKNGDKKYFANDAKRDAENDTKNDAKIDAKSNA